MKESPKTEEDVVEVLLTYIFNIAMFCLNYIPNARIITTTYTPTPL